MSNILEARDITKSYSTDDVVLEVLKGVNLTIEEGEFVAIMGASGTGKSTLLHVLGLVDEATSGEVIFKGENVSKLKAQRKDLIRNRSFGFVFQFYHLLPEFSALENVLFPNYIKYSMFAWPAKAAALKGKAVELMERFGLGGRLKHRPSQLSGGEQQRIAILRGIINDPEILFCDEPTGNLDKKSGGEILGLLKELNEKDNQTIVMVTHDDSIASVADRVKILTEGKIHNSK